MTETFAAPVFSRDEFASERFDYKPGQKVVFGGRSQESGKTTLGFKLLEYTATPEMPAYVIVPKPSDPVTEREGKRLGYRFTDRWPVEKTWQELGGNKPSGYIIQARFGDLDADQEKATAVANAVLVDRYKAGAHGQPSIVVCDDTVVMSKLMDLDKKMTTHIAMGGAMGVGGWYFVQKPTDSGKATIWAFENAEHTFLAPTRDTRNVIRYTEVSGQDKHLILACMSQLRKYQFLYVSGSGHVCIVDSQ
jgi:hypothetical protein